MKRKRMMFRLLLAVLCALAFASCATDTPADWNPAMNPLDAPRALAVPTEPAPDHGVFGPNWEAKRWFNSF